MSYIVRPTTSFKKAYKRLCKKYRSFEDDRDRAVEQITVNPFIGADLGNNVRKIRMAITSKGKGKSGGARIITYTLAVDEANGEVTLLTVYDKNEQSSISKKDIDLLLVEAGL